MSDRIYPRKWFRVSHRGGEIQEREFTRETEKMLFSLSWGGRKRRDAKVDTYGRWYPTREEADEALAVVNQRLTDKDDARRIRDAAPDLLEALTLASAALSNAAENGFYVGEGVFEKINDAFARSKGEATNDRD